MTADSLHFNLNMLFIINFLGRERGLFITMSEGYIQFSLSHRVDNVTIFVFSVFKTGIILNVNAYVQHTSTTNLRQRKRTSKKQIVFLFRNLVVKHTFQSF